MRMIFGFSIKKTALKSAIIYSILKTLQANVIDISYSIQIKSWAIKQVEKHNQLFSMIDSHWTQNQFETIVLFGLF